MRNLARQIRMGKAQKLQRRLKRANAMITRLQKQLKRAQKVIDSPKSAMKHTRKQNQTLRKKIKRANQKIKQLQKRQQQRSKNPTQEVMQDGNRKVVVLITYYIEALTDTEKSRPSTIVHPDDGTIAYPGGKDRVTLTKADLARIKRKTYNGTSKFTQLSEALIRASLVSQRLFDHSSSKVVALKTVFQGYVTPVATQRDHEIDRPIAGDGELRAVNFPYIQNTSLFKPRPRKLIGKLRIKKNSCLETLMLQTFKINLDKKFSINLNYESIWDICCPNKKHPENGEFQLSLRQTKRFFEHFKLKFIAVDLFMRVLMYYDPNDARPEGSKKHSEHHWKGPTILRVLVHQNHAYLIDHDVNSFDRKIKVLADEFQQSMEVGSHYYLREEQEEEAQIQVLLDLPEQIQKYITTFKKKATYVKILTQYSIELL